MIRNGDFEEGSRLCCHLLSSLSIILLGVTCEGGIPVLLIYPHDLPSLAIEIDATRVRCKVGVLPQPSA